MSAEYPKWVQPHNSHLTRLVDGRSHTKEWTDFHIDRDGVLKVIVQDEAEEAYALADKNPAPEPVESTEEETHH